MKANGWLRLASSLLFVVLGSLAVPAQAQVTVTSADPNTAPQGSTNLIVKIHGSGFKKGQQKSAFYVSGTTNPGGITVNSTAFVSSSEVDANITVSSTATTSGFDIYVTSGGRTGKGTDLFSVTSISNAGGQCVTQGPAQGWTQVGVLNPLTSSGTPLYSAGALGTAVRVQLVKVGGVPQFYAGLVGSGAGAQTIAFVLNLDGTVRRSWWVLSNYEAQDIAAGDVNGDGVPDFVMGSAQNAAFVFLGHLVTDSSGNWDYNVDPVKDVIQVTTPGPPGFGWRVAIGDLNGDGLGEVAVVAVGGGKGKNAQAGAVYLYAYSNPGLTLIKTIVNPAGGGFGQAAVAIGELTTDGLGSRIRDLAVSTGALIYVFQDPLGSSALPYLALNVSSPSGFGNHLGIGDVNRNDFPGLMASANGTVVEFPGPLYAGETPEYTLQPDPSPVSIGSNSWATGFDIGDIDGDGRVDVLAGDPQASYASNCAPGAAFAFTTGSLAFPGYSDLFEVPQLGASGFGHSVAAAPFNSTVNQPIILIGQNSATVGTQTGAGQVYIYRKTQ